MEHRGPVSDAGAGSATIQRMRGSSTPVERWLLLGALGPVLVAILIHSVLAGLTERALVNQTLEAEARSLAQLSARLASAAIEFEETQSIHELLEHAANSPNFESGLVLRADGSVVASTGDSSQLEARTREFMAAGIGELVRSEQSLSFVAGVGEPPIGRLVISLDTEGAEVVLRNHLLRGGLMSVLASLVASVVVVRLVRVIRRREGLERHREILRETGQMARVGGWELTMPDRRLELSEEAAALLGLPPRGSGDLLKLIAAQEGALGRCIDQGEPFDIELEVPWLQRWLRVQGRAERVGDKTARVFGALQDISELRETRERALASSRSKTQFLANTSHEIRTPLNGIIGLTELALDTELSPEQRGYLEGVRHSGRTMLAIINDLLDVARIEAGKMQLELLPVSLEELLVAATRAVSAQAQEKGVDIILTIPHGLPLRRMADGLRLTQLVTNLLGNAVKFTARGEIELRLEAGAGDALLLSVRDTGIGIPAERLEAIFEAFTQSDGSTTRRFGGSGLGLTITRELAGLMNGDISVQSAVGVGSTFTATLRLPITPEIDPAESAAYDPVLVVDANPTRATATLELLRRLKTEGVVVSDVASACLALERNGPRFGVALLGAAFQADTELRAKLEARGLKAIPLVPFGAMSATGDHALRFPLNSTEVRDLLASHASHHEVGHLPTQHPGRGLQVLVAEDNAINATVACRLLERAGHGVTHVWNGKAAVAAVTHTTFDLVLMDIQMPELDGLEATRQIRAREREGPDPRRMCIVAMTANARPSDEAECLAAGMDSFLSKPVDLKALNAVLDAVATARAA